MKMMKRLVAIGGFALLLGACGTKEANEMTKLADVMCACKDAACADGVYTKLADFAKSNEGKEVPAATADRYNAEMDRAQRCYDSAQRAAQ